MAILSPVPGIIVTALIIIYAKDLEVPFLNGQVGDGSDSNVTYGERKMNMIEQDILW